MDAINISLVITIAIYLSLALILLFKAQNNKIKSSYLLIIASVICWTLGMILYRGASPERSFFWCTVLYIMATFTSSTFFYFSIIFPYEDKVKPVIKFFIILLNLLIISAVFIPGFIIRGVEVPKIGEKIILWGQGYFLYVIYIAGLFSAGFLVLFKKYRVATGVVRDQIRYVYWGDFFSANLAMVTNLILVWFGNFKFNWLGQDMSVIMVLATVYAIVKYRLMDIRIVMRKIFIYLGIAGFTYGIFYLIAWIYTRAFGDVFASTGYLVGIIVAPLFVAAFYGINQWLNYLSNKYFFISLYNYQATINKLANDLNHSINLNKIVDAIVGTIKKTMKLDRAGVLLVQQNQNPANYQIAKVVGFNKKNGISLVQDSFLTQHLQKIQKPLVRDELTLLARDAKNNHDKTNFETLFQHMKHIEASLCLPLMSNNQLIGIIVLGSKISGDAYTKEDLELLDTLSKQAGIAIENARLYRQVQDFNKTLQTKVDEQTKDIQDKAVHLEKLLAMRSEFLDIASHQLRTPTSVIKGTLSMMKEGDMDKMSAEEKAHFIEGMFQKSVKLESIINDILVASEMDTADFDIKVEDTIELDKFVEKEVNEHQFDAQEKKIALTFEKSTKGSYKIKGSAKYLEQVIDNLISNAIKYTPDGTSEPLACPKGQGFGN